MGALPDRFGLALDRRLRRFGSGTVLAGGHPGRIVTLTRAGADALDARVGPGAADTADRDPAVSALAGRLVASGMAHPRRPAPGPGAAGPGARLSVTVVVPAFDRAVSLDRCLRSLGADHPVVVVDDGSHDPDAVAAVCADHRVRLVRRAHNRGPGAARGDGLAHVGTDLVAFVDSDCTVGPGWLDRLTWLFEDPGIGAVAPRVVASVPAGDPPMRVVDRYHATRSPLDLGPDEGEVGPERAVRYVPTAALVVRRSAIDDVGGFAPGMRVGEDVDLVWRLVDAGWRVRYEPSVTVGHAEPRGWVATLARRFRYGTSAGPLAARHPGRLAPVELRPWPTAAALAVLAGRPRPALGAVAASALVLGRSTHPLGIPARRAWVWSAQGAGWTLVGLGRAATMLAAPALVALAARGPRGARAAAVLVLAPPVVEWVRRRPDLDLPRWVAASVADDLAYGAGVWTGCLRSGSFGPLLPAIRRPRVNRDVASPQI